MYTSDLTPGRQSSSAVYGFELTATGQALGKIRVGPVSWLARASPRCSRTSWSCTFTRKPPAASASRASRVRRWPRGRALPGRLHHLLHGRAPPRKATTTISFPPCSRARPPSGFTDSTCDLEARRASASSPFGCWKEPMPRACSSGWVTAPSRSCCRKASPRTARASATRPWSSASRCAMTAGPLSIPAATVAMPVSNRTHEGRPGRVLQPPRGRGGRSMTT